jgi:hypothetical protein
MAITVHTYVTDAEIDEFFRGLTGDPTWTYTNIPLLIRGDATTTGSAFDMLKQCIDYVFCDPSLAVQTFLVNGEDSPTIFSPTAPITDLTEVTIINADGTEETFNLSGSDRQVFWDHATGKITFVKNGEYFGPYNDIDVCPPYTERVFPHGCENVRLVGNFGIDVPPLAKLIQMLMMYKQLQLQQPEPYNKLGNIVEEKIGRYEYRLGVYGASNTGPGTVYSLDAYIELLVDKLPKINTYSYEAI